MSYIPLVRSMIFLTLLSLSACGGGSDSSTDSQTSNESLQPHQVDTKSLQFFDVLARNSITAPVITDTTDSITISYASFTGAHSQFYLNVDNNAATGFRFDNEAWDQTGVDYMIENGDLFKSTSSSTAWSWNTDVGEINYQKNGDSVSITIKKSLLQGLGSILKIGVMSRDNNWDVEDIFPRSTLMQKYHLTTTSTEDTTPPVINLNGSESITIPQASNFSDLGATATDNIDGEISDRISTNSNVDADRVGNYRIIYSVSDNAGNTASVTRTVSVVVGSSGDVFIDGSNNDWLTIPEISNTSAGIIKAHNKDNTLYLMIQTSSIGTNTQIFLDTDNNSSTGFQLSGATWNQGGIDYMIENIHLNKAKTNDSNWSWNYDVAEIEVAGNSTVIEVAIPTSSLINLGNTINIGFISRDSNWNVEFVTPLSGPVSYSLNQEPPHADNTAPTATNVSMGGIPKTGETLTLNYTFNDSDGDSEGNSIIAWSTPTQELQRSSSKTFVIPAGYVGDTIGAWVHPVDQYGLEGIAHAATNNMLTIQSEGGNTENHAPTATSIVISGIPQTGQTLILGYTFQDEDNDAEGSSIINWSISGTQIQSSTSKTFVIPSGNIGNTISASIRPIDSNGLQGQTYQASNSPTVQNSNSSSGGYNGHNNNSPYLEAVNLPAYDINNSEMMLISSNADWANINNPTIRYFFVEPGDYSAAGLATTNGRIRLTQSGTSGAKRYILLHNGNNTHPGKLNRSQLAKVGIHIEGANYWVIDRMAYWDSSRTYNPVIIYNSDHNIINRYFMHDVGSGIYIYPDSDNNTIQNCRVDRDSFQLKHDRAAFGLFNNHLNNQTMKNNKIINNESRNFVDAVQLIRQNALKTNINYEGTIIDSNHFYIDSTVYTNCNGVHDANGSCAYAENPIDVKTASSNSSNPVIISNNKMWGYKKSDTTNSNLSDNGSVMPLHANVDNIIIRNNIAFDVDTGLTIAAPMPGELALENAVIENNIFNDVKQYVIALLDTNNVTVKNNLLKNTSNAYPWWLYLGTSDDSSSNATFSDNVIVNNNDSQPTVSQTGATISGVFTNNHYFQVNAGNSGQIADPSDIIHSVDPTANYNDLVFTTDRFTNNPRTMIVPKVIKP